MPPAALNRHRQLRRLAFGNHACNRLRIQQQLPRGDPPAAIVPQQDLHDDTAQLLGERRLHLGPVLGRVEMDDPIDRLGGAVRRETADDEVSGRRRLERDVHEGTGPHIFDHQHVGILAQRRTRGGQHVLFGAGHLTLADERLAALVDDVDFALDRDDMITPRPVDQIDKCGYERPLAAPTRARDEHQTFGLDHQRLDFPPEGELVRRCGAAGHQLEDSAGTALVAEAHAADAAHVLELADPVDGSAASQSFVMPFGRNHQQQRFDIICRQERFLVERLNLAVHTRPRTCIRRDVQRRRAAHCRQSQQLLEA